MPRYSNHTSQQFSSIAPAGDGGFFLAGAAQTYGEFEVWLLSVSPEGAVVKEDMTECEYGGDGSYYSALVPMPDGGVLAAGRVMPRSANYKGEFCHGLARRFSAEGSLVWERTYMIDQHYREFVAAAALADGGAVLAGRRWSAKEAQDLVLRIDGKGEPVLWTMIGDAESSIQAVAARPDGTFLCAGQRPHGDPGQKRAFLARLDPAGERVFDGTIDVDGVSEYRAVALRPAGGALLGGGISGGPDDAGQRGLVDAVDDKDNTLWRLQIDGGSRTLVKAIAMAPDGGAFLAGFCCEAPCAQTKPWAARVAEGGELLWQRALGEGEGMFEGALALPDGSAIFAGYSQGETGKIEAWLLHVDRNGREIGAALH